jgi:prepilin-type N-terminal cleavage/methylation domain-containing protein/prepilin-type processing-associated H-X9-DG protein
MSRAHCHAKERSPARGFTLVELLVVIGIIALLIAILMPALSRARSESLKVKCLSNLKQLGTIAQQYANENRGYVPRDYNYDAQYRGDPPNIGFHILWAEAFAHYFDADKWPLPLTDGTGRDPILGPYLLKIPVYQCPAKPRSTQPFTYGTSSWALLSDDGTDHLPSTGEGQPAIKITTVRYPSQVAYMTEVTQRLPDNNFDHYDMKDHTGLAYDPVGTPNATVGNIRIMDDNRHNGSVNIMYLDGHAISKKIIEVTKYDFRWLSDKQNQ